MKLEEIVIIYSNRRSNCNSGSSSIIITGGK